MRLYVELNVHVVSEEDYSYVQSRIREVLGREVKVYQLSSTELALEDVSEEEARRLLELKFVERVGEILAEFSQSQVQDLVKYLRERGLRPITRLKDFRIRWLLVQTFGKPQRLSPDLVLLRDYVQDSDVKILVVRPIQEDRFADLVDMFHDAYTGDLTFIVCDVESEHEAVSCVRICCALKLRLFLVNPRVKFTDKKLQEDFKKFYGLCKTRVFSSLEECLSWLRQRVPDMYVIALSMHALAGEKTLEELVRKLRGKHLVFVLGGEVWGLTPRQVELCDAVVRLGPSTGIPMSISETIAYVTHLVRRALAQT